MMSTPIVKNKHYFSLGLMAFLAISLLAGYFFRERVALLDAAYQLFMLIYKGDFAIQSGRFGAVVTQVFPLISVKLGLSLKMVMLSYSLSFPLSFVFIHPLAIIPFLFCWCLTYLCFPEKAKLSHFIGFFVVFVLLIKYTLVL